MTRDAELRARDFAALVLGGVHAETEVGVAQRLLLQAQTSLAYYAEPGWARETMICASLASAFATAPRA